MRHGAYTEGLGHVARSDERQSEVSGYTEALRHVGTSELRQGVDIKSWGTCGVL